MVLDTGLLNPQQTLMGKVEQSKERSNDFPSNSVL